MLIYSMKIYSVRYFAPEPGRKYNNMWKMFLCGPNPWRDFLSKLLSWNRLFNTEATVVSDVWGGLIS